MSYFSYDTYVCKNGFALFILGSNRKDSNVGRD
jgi:hypothetical protein